jgi:hypothetical protein
MMLELVARKDGNKGLRIEQNRGLEMEAVRRPVSRRKLLRMSGGVRREGEKNDHLL